MKIVILLTVLLAALAGCGNSDGSHGEGPPVCEIDCNYECFDECSGDEDEVCFNSCLNLCFDRCGEECVSVCTTPCPIPPPPIEKCLPGIDPDHLYEICEAYCFD